MLAPIFNPLLAMVGLTGVVYCRLYQLRIREIVVRKMSMRDLALGKVSFEEPLHLQASANFENLLELPVLFYALCPVLALEGLGSHGGFVAAAWGYVALRALHSCIHCTYNRILHRFPAHAASSVLLFGMWGALALAHGVGVGH